MDATPADLMREPEVSLEDRIICALRLSRYAGCADFWQIRFAADYLEARSAQVSA